MVYRITGGIGLLLLGLTMVSGGAIPTAITGVFLLVAGITLLDGV
jgi:hypothetical protein